MALIEIVGYHACKDHGGQEHIQSKAPFLSGSGPRQWLTQGYYFWTDSEHFAKWWGRVGYKGRYAIVKCKLIVEERLLLDLVGSVASQLYFLNLMRDFRKKVHAVGENPDEVTVNDVIAHYRRINSDVDFPFVAIKSQDLLQKTDDLPNNGKYPYRKKRSEFMPALTRQQICLFESGYESIVEKEIIYPNYSAKSTHSLNGYTKLGVTRS